MIKILHYIDGKWTTDPKISVFDLSVIRGFGVFDFMRTYNKKPLKIDAHIDRLFNSGKRLGITIPQSKSKIKKIVMNGIKKNDMPEYNIRIVVTGGVTPDGISKSNTSTLTVLFSKALDYPKTYYSEGISVISREHERVYADVKSLNYLTAVQVLEEAKKIKAVEVLYTDPFGRILEGTTSNFFCVINGRLITPKNNILIGITRNMVITIAKKLTIPVLETDILYSQIGLFDEAFITASNKEVMPVVKIDDMNVGNKKVGGITKLIVAEYRNLVKTLA